MSIQTIIDRAAADPSFLERLTADPEGTCRAAGLEALGPELAALLAAPMSDAPAAEALQARLSHSP